MLDSISAATLPRELAHRAVDGLEVTLLWSGNNSVTVTVSDRDADTFLELAVAPDRALDAFYHPYAYASGQGAAYALRTAT